MASCTGSVNIHRSWAWCDWRTWWRGCWGCCSHIIAHRSRTGCGIAHCLRRVAWVRGILRECLESTVLIAKVRGIFLPTLEHLGHNFNSIDFLSDGAMQPMLEEMYQCNFIQLWLVCKGFKLLDEFVCCARTHSQGFEFGSGSCSRVCFPECVLEVSIKLFPRERTWKGLYRTCRPGSCSATFHEC